MKFIFINSLDYNREILMSTMAEIRIPAKRRFPVLRVLFLLLLALILVVGAAVAYAYHAAHSALPQLEGRLQIAGLDAPASVTRDQHGVPTIEAATLDDL